MEGEGEGEGEGGGAVAVGAVVGEQYCSEEERELTVRKTSLFFPGDGFAAYDPQTGEMVFRVDTYGRGPALADQLVLMDTPGASILTFRRKWPSLHQRWEGFLGERSEGQEPLFTVRRSSIFGGDRGDVAVEVHGVGGTYRIEGSFAQRCCRVLHEGRGGGGERGGVEVVVAEIKRKVDACAHVVLGRDVFRLCLRPRFDAAFAMGLVLVLDQICRDDEEDDISPADRDDIQGADSHADGDAHHS
ncbi:protein LURP-one-related 5-like [Phoenix dactylifera]|uniref:Protein LURP-one-related 5-like n=1 Tax=Phoenix dactylifera TaxID=42345 RepID=A0A8B7BE38_PHODC|nr:protein LURP-one-related 5-like [Phoenix dactylifera]